MRDTAPKKTVLLLYNFGGDFENGSLPLVHRSYQPIGIGKAIIKPFLRRFVGAVDAQLCGIIVVDQQPGQVRAIKFK